MHYLNQKRLGFCVLVFLGVSGTSFGAPKEKKKRNLANKILTVAENIRFLDESEALIGLNTVDGKDVIDYELKVLSSTDRRAYLEFLAPKEEKGRKMLSANKKYWSTFPDSKRVVAINKKEMIGNSAFDMADIFQIDSKKDYKPKIVKNAEAKSADQIMLELSSRHDETPYYRIEYWVEKKGYFPVRAKFYSRTGKHLKTMRVLERAQLAGKLRPSKTEMVDEIRDNKKSIWHTKTLSPAKVPDTVFSLEFLRRR